VLIDRYIAKQILICSGIATATLSGVFILGNVVKEVFDLLVNRRVPWLAILDFVACAAPYSLAFALPWGFLTAIFLVFGRMASDRELFALHTSGVSIARVCRSVFIMAIAFCLVCLLINAEINPRARLRMKDMLHTLAVSTLLHDSSSDRIFNLPRKRIYIGSQAAGHLKNIQIYEFSDALELEKVVFAKQGWVESQGDNDEILIHLQDVTSDDRDPVNAVAVPRLRIDTMARDSHVDITSSMLRPTDATEGERDGASDTSMPSFHRGMAVREYTYEISLFEVMAHYSSKTSKYRSLGSYTLKGLRDELRLGTRGAADATAFLTEFNKRIALSLACLAFALTGVPLAIMCHRKETTIGFGLGLTVACLYYTFFMIADEFRGNPGARPELWTWASNSLFGTIGVILCWRLSKR
jgi:lipopolysaccharide export system permease protein